MPTFELYAARLAESSTSDQRPPAQARIGGLTLYLPPRESEKAPKCGAPIAGKAKSKRTLSAPLCANSDIDGEKKPMPAPNATLYRPPKCSATLSLNAPPATKFKLHRRQCSALVRPRKTDAVPCRKPAS